MSEERLTIAAAVGLTAGFLSGLFGVGGGILMVPGLVGVMGMNQRIAHGTSLAAINLIVPLGILGYMIHGKVDWAAAAVIGTGAVLGAVVGTTLLHRVSQRRLRFAFAAFLLAAAVRLLISLPAAGGRGRMDALMVVGLIAVGLLSGVTAGLLGVGGGVVIIPILVIFVGVPDVIAKGTALTVTLPTALVGTWRNVAARNVRVRVALTAGSVGAGAAFAGSQLSVRVDPRLSKVLFAALLLAVAASLAARREREPSSAGAD